MTGDPCLAKQRYYTLCKCYLSIFTKIKLQKSTAEKAQLVFSVVVLHLEFNFYLLNKFNVFKRGICWVDKILVKTVLLKISTVLTLLMFTADK